MSAQLLVGLLVVQCAFALHNSATSGTDVFLQGTYMTVGVDRRGYLGTLRDGHACPAGFFCDTTQTTVGVSAFFSGTTPFGSGTPPAGDFFNGGTPDERWSLGAGGSQLFTQSMDTASGSVAPSDTTFSIQDLSDASQQLLKVKTVQESVSQCLHVEQVFSFNDDDAFITIDVSVTNMCNGALNDVKFARIGDCDQDYSLGTSTTDNTVTVQNPPSATAAVQCKGTRSGTVLQLESDDTRARAFTPIAADNVYSANWNTPPAVGNTVNTNYIALWLDMGSIPSRGTDSFRMSYGVAQNTTVTSRTPSQTPVSVSLTATSSLSVSNTPVSDTATASDTATVTMSPVAAALLAATDSSSSASSGLSSDQIGAIVGGILGGLLCCLLSLLLLYCCCRRRKQKRAADEEKNANKDEEESLMGPSKQSSAPAESSESDPVVPGVIARAPSSSGAPSDEGKSKKSASKKSSRSSNKSSAKSMKSSTSDGGDDGGDDGDDGEQAPDPSFQLMAGAGRRPATAQESAGLQPKKRKKPAPAKRRGPRPDFRLMRRGRKDRDSSTDTLTMTVTEPGNEAVAPYPATATFAPGTIAAVGTIGTMGTLQTVGTLGTANSMATMGASFNGSDFGTGVRQTVRARRVGSASGSSAGETLDGMRSFAGGSFAADSILNAPAFGAVAAVPAGVVGVAYEMGSEEDDTDSTEDNGESSAGEVKAIKVVMTSDTTDEDDDLVVAHKTHALGYAPAVGRDTLGNQVIVGVPVKHMRRKVIASKRKDSKKGKKPKKSGKKAAKGKKSKTSKKGKKAKRSSQRSDRSTRNSTKNSTKGSTRGSTRGSTKGESTKGESTKETTKDGTIIETTTSRSTNRNKKGAKTVTTVKTVTTTEMIPTKGTTKNDSTKNESTKNNSTKNNSTKNNSTKNNSTKNNSTRSNKSTTKTEASTKRSTRDESS